MLQCRSNRAVWSCGCLEGLRLTGKSSATASSCTTPSPTSNYSQSTRSRILKSPNNSLTTKPLLFANDRSFGGRNFQAHELVIGIEIQNDLYIVGGHLQSFVRFAFRGHCACPIDSDCSRQEFLRH